METSVLVVILTFGFIQSATSTISFHLNEEVPLRTFVGSIPSASNFISNLTSDVIASLRYNFLSPDNYTQYFSLNSSSGFLMSDERIDREQICGQSDTCRLHFDVVVRSAIGLFFKVLDVDVIISDINDNAPFFQRHMVTFNISEDVDVGYIIKLEKAQDRDVGINSVQSYELIPSTSPFRIQLTSSNGDSHLTLRLNQPLDRERYGSSYLLHVKAKDGGMPPFSGVLYVMINILDINDNPPLFQHSFYNISVLDNVPVNTSILPLTATDIDIGENGHILYRFSPVQQPNTNLREIQKIFKMDQFMNFGRVKVIASLQNYQGRSFEFQIEARDAGVPSLFSRADVIVRVLTSRNNAPSMHVHVLKPGINRQVVVSEAAMINTPVVHVQVVDIDTGLDGQVHCAVNDTHFWLQDQSVAGLNEFTMLTKSKLDREQIDHTFVQITCTDQGTPAMSSFKNLEIRISDENDNAPRFIHDVYKATISENSPIGSSIMQVVASDDDFGKNAMLSYSINPATQNFAIDSKTGIISAKSVLDRENIDSYTFRVLAKDNGFPPLTGTATVILNIADLNDNPPIFSANSYEFYAMKSVRIGTIIGHVTAYDSDANDNGKFSLSLSFPKNITSVPFDITSSGIITADRTLERVTQSEYHFKIMAIDHGQPQRQSLASVTVHVIDSNIQTLIG